jgi:hypothetical protein
MKLTCIGRNEHKFFKRHMSFNTIKVNNTDTNYTHSIFDISDYNSGATYTDLSAALAAIPESK